MQAQNSSGSLIHQLDTSGSQLALNGYYRSKLFIAPYTINPLLAAANPIFSLIERLSLSPTLPPITMLRENIEHELHAFYSQLAAANYAKELIAIARYLVCATIDELIGKSYLRLYNKPVEFNAFTTVSHDGIEPQQRFFEVVSYIKERPNQHLDVIELAYFCLITGFEGEQHLRVDGRQNLDNLIEELYLLIQQHRVYKPYQLFYEPTIRTEPSPLNNGKPTLLILGLAFGLVFMAFFSSHLYLSMQAKAVLQSHSIDFREK